MKQKKTWIARSLITLAVLAVVVVVAVLFYFKGYLPSVVAKKSFPQIEGELQLKGLRAPVEVIRDKSGTPHIYASSSHDLFFAQGYVHAQERFWQMDTWRHIGSGRLSEMFGKGQIKTDAFLRTVGWRVVAEQEYNQLRPEAKAIVEAYTEGVNAYIQGKSNEELSLEYAVLRLLNSGYTVEPWTPVHSLTWGKAMAWDLGGNMDAEIERAVLLKTLTADQVAELFPEFPSEYPVIVPRIGVNQAAADATDTVDATRSALAENQSEHTKKQAEQIVALLKNVQQNHSLVSDWLGEPGPDIGSNSWVVSGKRTTTGKPLLANDMHLGIQMPSIWFQVALHCMPKTDACPFNVTGYSFAGVPGVIVGHNDRIAWAFTNLGPDVQDLFIEKVNPDNPNQYEVNGKWVDFETRKETITASGGVSQEITVRITRHGPVVSDTYGPIKPEANAETKVAGFKDRSGIELPEHYVIALSWTALYPNSPFEAVWGFNQAKNWEDFRKAARNWSVPAQNLLYADIDGNIGYQSPGDIPIRKKGDGTLPVPGWTGEYDWAGYLPFEKLPYSYNPQSGYIVTANNQANPRDYPYLITKDYDYGQRAQRIVEMIEEAPGKIDAAYYQKMHGDAKNLNAEALVPVLMSVDLPGDLKEIRDELFLSWNYHEDADSKPAAVFEWFWQNLVFETFKDDLPATHQPAGGARWYVVMKRLIEQPNSHWWDDKTTVQVENRDDMFIRAFKMTVSQMKNEYGRSPKNWPAWGKLHAATFRNQTLGKSGVGLIESLFNRGPVITGGTKSAVNATGWVVGKSFEVNWLPSERLVVDLSDFDKSLTGHTTGQSGHAYHKHYDDMLPMWSKVEYVPMWWQRSSVEADQEGTLRLIP